ncbi:MAG: lysophospholipid acyltransferase family protein [Candidatus Marinimicrobia bacterium]|mgnify:CR=1 FL=1|nr:lysophospholipid acyltransferase family protein [Candidatus Neomarinimicrobiota bacterium]MDP6612318.1 lysophospholipid acyltransferase family protein [Candidatus Neomarinimicrobiota bacterium]|tara:strand:+ start:4768 stop:5475 length:708 start_codon:yes stop_codon:yes gene_type:complete
MFRIILSLILWPIWVMMFLLGTLIYSVSIIFFPADRLHPLARVLARLLMLFGGQWFQVRGNAPDPKNGPYLYMMNHESLFDGFMMVAGIRHYFTGVGAVEQFSYPIWGYLVKKYGVIPIIRQQLDNAISSLVKVEEAIGRGVSMMIAPEGTRTLTGKLSPFKKGPFHVAKNTGITIIPVGLLGAYKAKNKNDWRIKPSVLTTVFGDPIKEEDYKHLTLDELRDLIKEKITELIDG